MANDLILSNQAVVQSARHHLESILDESGTILYSSCETLKPGKYYFLGLNPGGSEEGTPTIRQCLCDLEVGEPKGNAYLDQDWSGFRKFRVGGHPLQRNYQHLFGELGEELRSVCASNLIFRRSAGEDGAGGRKMAGLCWPVHKTILEIVQPAAIITFGRQPFSFIREMLAGSPPEYLESGHGRWKWQVLILSTGEKLVGLPHFSRYALRSHPSVLEEIRKRVG